MRVFSFLRGHKIFKVTGLAIGGLIAAFVVLMIVTAGRSWWGGYQWQKKADKFQAALEKPYREDSFGGRTPEETWQMFLSALKQGDVEGASRYVAVDKREKRKMDLQKAKDEKRLEEIIKKFSVSLEKQENGMATSDKVYYIIPVKNSSGEVEAYPIIFYLNPYTKVWKILVL